MLLVLLAVTPGASWGQEPGAAQDTAASKPSAADVLRPSFPTLLSPPPLLLPTRGLPAADSLGLSAESILQRRLEGPAFREDLATALYIRLLCGSDDVCQSYLEAGYEQRYEQPPFEPDILGVVLEERLENWLGNVGRVTLDLGLH